MDWGADRKPIGVASVLGLAGRFPPGAVSDELRSLAVVVDDNVIRLPGVGGETP